MCSCVDATGQSGHDRKAVCYKRRSQPSRPSCSLSTRLPRADARRAACVHKIPQPLQVKHLDGMNGVTQLQRVTACTMHADTKVLNSGVMKYVERKTCVSLNVCAANEIRWCGTRMSLDIFGDGFEPRILPRPQGLVRPEFTPWGRRHDQRNRWAWWPRKGRGSCSVKDRAPSKSDGPPWVHGTRERA